MAAMLISAISVTATHIKEKRRKRRAERTINGFGSVDETRASGITSSSQTSSRDGQRYHQYSTTRVNSCSSYQGAHSQRHGNNHQRHRAHSNPTDDEEDPRQLVFYRPSSSCSDRSDFSDASVGIVRPEQPWNPHSGWQIADVDAERHDQRQRHGNEQLPSYEEAVHHGRRTA